MPIFWLSFFFSFFITSSNLIRSWLTVRANIYTGLLLQRLRCHQKVVAVEANKGELADVSEMREQDNEAYSLKNWYQGIFRVYIILQGILLRASKASSRRGASSTASMNTSIFDNLSHSALPKLPLPQFKGKYEELISFHDRFQPLMGSSARKGHFCFFGPRRLK